MYKQTTNENFARQNHILYFLFNALKQRFPNYIYVWLSTLLMNNQTDQKHNELCVRIDINEHRKFDSK